MILKTIVLVVSLILFGTLLLTMVKTLMASRKYGNKVFKLTLTAWGNIFLEIIAVSIMVWLINGFVGYNFNSIESAELGLLIFLFSVFVKKRGEKVR